MVFWMEDIQIEVVISYSHNIKDVMDDNVVAITGEIVVQHHDEILFQMDNQW